VCAFDLPPNPRDRFETSRGGVGACALQFRTTPAIVLPDMSHRPFCRWNTVSRREWRAVATPLTGCGVQVTE